MKILVFFCWNIMSITMVNYVFFNILPVQKSWKQVNVKKNRKIPQHHQFVMQPDFFKFCFKNWTTCPIFMDFALKVCWKTIVYHENLRLYPTCTDFAAQVGRKALWHPVYAIWLQKYTKDDISNSLCCFIYMFFNKHKHIEANCSKMK